jgi:hypothetical protein
MISGYDDPDATTRGDVHAIVTPERVHDQLDPDAVPSMTTPVGRISCTVVIPDDDAGPEFVTRMT